MRRQDLLREIGVTEDVLTIALGEGDAAAARCTSNHPPIATGIYRFAETVRSLAEQLAPQGWTRVDDKNFSTVVRPDQRVAIAVASGNDGTGDLESDVSTRFPKGTMTATVVNANLSLPLDERYEADNKQLEIQTETWFLLHARKEDDIVAELSLPKSIVGGFVQTWEPRIPLRPLPIGSTVDLSDGDLPINPDVDVKKKRGS